LGQIAGVAILHSAHKEFIINVFSIHPLLNPFGALCLKRLFQQLRKLINNTKINHSITSMGGTFIPAPTYPTF
jgi:hypothetical protein